MGKILNSKITYVIGFLVLIGTFFEEFSNTWDKTVIFFNKVTYIEINDANKGCFDYIPYESEVFEWGKDKVGHESLKRHDFDFLEVEHISGSGVWFSKKPRIIQGGMIEGTTNLCRSDSDSCNLIFDQSDSAIRILEWREAYAKPIEQGEEVSIAVRYHYCPGETVAFKKTRSLKERARSWPIISWFFR